MANLPTDPEISVCIFTLDPPPSVFKEMIAGLKAQTLERSKWEIVIVDNGSHHSVEQLYRNELTWHNAVRFVNEPNRGFQHGHRRGIVESRGDITLFVGDDCVLAPDYLEKTKLLLATHPEAGVLSGNVTYMVFSDERKLEKQPTYTLPGIDSFSGYFQTYEKNRFTPAMRGSQGMAIRHAVGQAYVNRFWVYHEIGARLGMSALRGTDLDLSMHALNLGFAIARSDELRLTHLLHDEKASFYHHLRRAFVGGFYTEIFAMRWGWHTYQKGTLYEFLNTLHRVFQRTSPLSAWFIRLAVLCGELRAKYFLIQNRDLVQQVVVVPEKTMRGYS